METEYGSSSFKMPDNVQKNSYKEQSMEKVTWQVTANNYQINQLNMTLRYPVTHTLLWMTSDIILPPVEAPLVFVTLPSQLSLRCSAASDKGFNLLDFGEACSFDEFVVLLDGKFRLFFEDGPHWSCFKELGSPCGLSSESIIACASYLWSTWNGNWDKSPPRRDAFSMGCFSSGLSAVGRGRSRMLRFRFILGLQNLFVFTFVTILNPTSRLLEVHVRVPR